ncbi:hypothetical protein [Frigoribacterium sp. SL97]|uniref:hypothetical protein n=1 Tax=Frigoribacterium sp. SL97 TaxID=2994664 RepID=UPI002270DDF6|nr:hypothetical protein [Frigoribacterium sp. SL97]WAC52176.1 hypothetical protein OVA02_02560 [Frigoribacterium sp. SL97]
MSQQDIVIVTALGGDTVKARAKLLEVLEAYPPVKVIDLQVRESPFAPGTELVAVVETI